MRTPLQGHSESTPLAKGMAAPHIEIVTVPVLVPGLVPCVECGTVIDLRGVPQSDIPPWCPNCANKDAA